MIYFLDTNICIYFLKGLFPSILVHLKSLGPQKIKIPSIVKAELLYGAEKSTSRKQTLERVNTFLEPYEITGFNDKASSFYAQIRSECEKHGNIIGPNDLIIAATVMAGNGILITNNEKEFKRIKMLKTENWTKS